MKPLDREHIQAARNLLAEQGVEMTSDEVEIDLKAAYANIREQMRKRGFHIPDSDEELFLMMRNAQEDKYELKN